MGSITMIWCDYIQKGNPSCFIQKYSLGQRCDGSRAAAVHGALLDFFPLVLRNDMWQEEFDTEQLLKIYSFLYLFRQESSVFIIWLLLGISAI